MNRVFRGDAPTMPEAFAGLREQMTSEDVAEARPELDDPAEGWALPGWQGVEFRVVFGARNLQVQEVVFWTWHPGGYLVKRWGEPELLGDPSNPQAVWRNDEARIRATIPPRSGREVVVRFTRFVPATDWIGDDGRLSFEEGSWLGRDLDALRKKHDDLIWAEDRRSGRVVVRLPSTEFGTDVVLEVEADEEGRVQRLLLRYAGTGYPALEKKVLSRLAQVFGKPSRQRSEDDRYEEQVFTGKERRLVMTNKLAALELSIEAL